LNLKAQLRNFRLRTGITSIPLVDVALATSAAPGFFARHQYSNSQYVGGVLFANARGVPALHEPTESVSRSQLAHGSSLQVKIMRCPMIIAVKVT